MKLARTPGIPAFVPFIGLVIASVFYTELHATTRLNCSQASPERTANAKSANVTRPKVSEEACPLVPIAPIARDGHRGIGFLRKPPGTGRFPAILFIHGGMVERPAETIKDHLLNAANPSRFLAAGYVVVSITYRSRDDDPQSVVSREDSLAAFEHLCRLSFVDPKSIVIYGCSGGGDLALEVAAATTEPCAIIPEEPASFIFAGIFNAKFPKRGERFVPDDSRPIGDNPRGFYTPEYQKLTRAKISRIRCPILIIQGDQDPRVFPFNSQVFIPELRALGKKVEVITYSGEPHCFNFNGNGPRTPHPEVALKAFHDIDAFCRRHLKTSPKAIPASIMKYVAVN
ncbi:MAG TPA: prolyl oligopeptidase family serine peptidase [Blastocatellia bacterium]|nr:prolyl oligopeptidase family serine peptidase [Blastocatellia bacterium]